VALQKLGPCWLLSLEPQSIRTERPCSQWPLSVCCGVSGGVACKHPFPPKGILRLPIQGKRWLLLPLGWDSLSPGGLLSSYCVPSLCLWLCDIQGEVAVFLTSQGAVTTRSSDVHVF
jgi:hypothetical protein